MTDPIELADLAARLEVPAAAIAAMAEAASFRLVARPDGTRWLRLAEAARMIRGLDPEDPRWDRRSRWGRPAGCR